MLLRCLSICCDAVALSVVGQAKKKDEADDVIDAALKSVKYSVKDRGYPSEPAKAPADAAAAGDAAEGPAVANGHTSESEQPVRFTAYLLHHSRGPLLAVAACEGLLCGAPLQMSKARFPSSEVAYRM